MALFDGLLGGASADPYDLYGDILTAKQREALRARSSDQTWANAANFLAKAAMPTNKKIPLGGLLAGLAGAMGGSNQDEAVTTALKGSEITAKIAKLRREGKVLEDLGPFISEAIARRMAGGGGGAPSTTAPPPGVPPAAVPPAATMPPQPPVPAGGFPPGSGVPPGATTSLPATTQMAGLLGGGAEGIDALGGGNDIWTALAALSQGGGGGSGAPFDMASLGQGQGLPDLGQVRVEALSGEAAPAGRQGRVDFWQSQGAPKHVAEGIADRINAESGFNPSIMGDRGTSGGLYQHHAERLTRLKDFAAKQGKPWTDPGTQDQFAATEVRGGDATAARGWPAILAAPDRQAAATLWDKYFERSAAGPGSRLPDVGRVRIEPLGGEAAPAGRSGLIPGLGVDAETLGLMDAMAKLGGIDSPFSSLLETYYKSPGYLEEKTRVETQARKAIEAKEDPLIEAQKTRERLLVEEEIKPRLEAAIEKAKSPVLEEREKALATIARETKRLEIAGQAAVSIQDIDIIGDDGKTYSTKLPALEIARRNAAAAERRALGDLTPRARDIATRPVLSPEETARQTQRGKTQEETREVDVWTPAGPVKQTLTNAEIDRRRTSRAAGGAPQVGDIIDKPVMTPADAKISESFGERFIKMRDRAEAAEETITDTHNLRRKLDSGIFTGLDANFNLFMSKLGDTVGYRNLAEPDKIRNTEVFVAGIAKDVLAMAKELKPVSNTDLVFLDRMAGGVNMSAGAIRELLDMRERYARLAITRHNAEAGRKHPDTFKGTRQYIDMPPDYQIQESTTPSGNKVIINR